VSQKWSSELEICQMAGALDLKDALHNLRLLDDRSVDFEIKQKQDWVRSGSETYLYRFDVQFSTGKIQELVFKACVAWSPGAKLDSILQSWIDRRNILNGAGISTPKLFAYGRGILLEEYIPFSLRERLNTVEDHSLLLNGVAHLTGNLVHLGFEPIEPFGDLRSRGDDVVVIDFGEDLGQPRESVRIDNLWLLDRLLKTFSRWSVEISPEDEQKIIAVYYAACRGATAVSQYD
jgi:hypothetical protein